MRLPVVRRGLGLCLLLGWSVDAHAAGGAYAVDDAAIGKQGECQVESWLSFASNGSFVGVTQPVCVLQFGVPVEITTAFQAARADGDWAAFAGLQAKAILVPVEPNHVGVGLTLASHFNVTKGEAAFSLINVPITIKVHDQLRLNVNGGGLFDDAISGTYVTWGAGFEWDFAKHLTLISEIYGQVGNPSFPEPRVQAGLRYSPIGTIDLDVIYGHNIAGDNAQWMTVGLTSRF